jgi:hypothetical protein
VKSDSGRTSSWQKAVATASVFFSVSVKRGVATVRIETRSFFETTLSVSGSFLKRLASNRGHERTMPGRRRLRPDLSLLEDRNLLSTFTVTNVDNAGPGSFRWAITETNKTAINFSANFSNTKQVIRLDSALPTLADASNTAIQGPGANLLEISGQKKTHILVVSTGAQVEITGLTLSDGHAGAELIDGSAVSNSGTLVITDCALDNNAAKGPYERTFGGAVDNMRSGLLTMNGCTINNNVIGLGSSGYGGAIANLGKLSLINCTLSHNEVSYDGGAIFNKGSLSLSGCTIDDNKALEYNGGGVYNSGGSLVALNSTFSNNDAYDYGGGLYNTGDGVTSLTGCSFTANKGEDGGGIYNCSGSTVTINTSVLALNKATARSHLARGAGLATFGDATLSDTTINNNVADNSGGGIYQNGGKTTLTNCTVASNAGTDGAGICNSSGEINVTNCTLAKNWGSSKWYQTAAKGAGLWVDGSAHVTNTLFAGNTADRESDLSGTISGSNNVIGGAAAEQFLGPLAFNGGPTQTMALLPGSPAIGTGVYYSPTNPIPTTDQRGYPRNGAMDVGAYQYTGN